LERSAKAAEGKAKSKAKPTQTKSKQSQNQFLTAFYFICIFFVRGVVRGGSCWGCCRDHAVNLRTALAQTH